MRLTIATLVVTLLAAPVFAGSRKPAEPGPAALVDLAQVLTAYRKTQAFAKYRDRIRTQAEAYAKEMETLAQLRYCTEAERKEALALAAKPRRNNQEEARLKALTKVADDIENEISVLSQKTNATEAERKRLTDLQARRTQAIRGLAKEEADRRDAIQRLESDLMTEVENDLLAIVEKVAKDQKLPVIYERRAVLFGGNDLTEAVLKRLPK